MKKNVMMRVASALLVAVLLTTCAISGTFAKYVTSASGKDQARVAKWGFKTTELAIDMFDGEYTNVDSHDGVNVVAPGTTKTATVTLVPVGQGETEVKYHFDANISAEGSYDGLLSKLVWSLNDTEVGTFADLQAAINAQYDKDYEPNVLPTDTIKITWTWPYNSGDDTGDTTLGQDGTVSLTIKLSFTATQLD